MIYLNFLTVLAMLHVFLFTLACIQFGYLQVKAKAHLGNLIAVAFLLCRWLS